MDAKKRVVQIIGQGEVDATLTLTGTQLQIDTHYPKWCRELEHFRARFADPDAFLDALPNRYTGPLVFAVEQTD